MLEGLATPALDCIEATSKQASKGPPAVRSEAGSAGKAETSVASHRHRRRQSLSKADTEKDTDTDGHTQASMRPGNRVNTAVLLLFMLVCIMKTKSAILQDRNFLQVI